MNFVRDADYVVAAWLDEGPLALPDDTRRAIAVGLRTTPQRRGRFGRLAGSRRGYMLPGALRLATAIGALVLVVAGALLALEGRLPGLAPAASPDPSPTASPIAGPAPAGSPSAGAIAYVTQGRRIRVVDPVTGDQRDLIADELVGGAPSALTWSPDGRALAFVVSHLCGYDAFVVSVDGTTLRPLLEEATECTGGRPKQYRLDWSPDGSRVAVGDGSNVTVASLDGSAPVDLGSLCEGCQLDVFTQAGWSPDGTMFAARFHPAQESRIVIAVVDVATGTWIDVWERTASSAEEPFPQVWLPDGSLVIQAGDELFAVDPRNPQQRTRLALEGTSDTWFQVWSPDQSRVVWTEDGRLIVRELASGETVQVTDWRVNDRGAWSPDSSQIVVVRSGRFTVWVVDADGSNARQIAYSASGGLAWQPMWP